MKLASVVETVSPPVGKIFAVGDIHGQYQKLRKLMDVLPWNRESDQLVFLGDYIDRGPQPKKVVEYLINLQLKGGNLVFLMGNHDKLLLDYYHSESNYDLRLWRSIGGWKTIESYTGGAGIVGRPNFLPTTHRRFFEKLLPYYETEHYIFVHAGLKEGVPLAEQKLDNLLWMRRSFAEVEYDFGKTVIFGHTPMKSPYVSSTKIGIDTGAGYGNLLTAVELPEIRFHQV